MEFLGMNFECVSEAISAREMPHKDCLLTLLSKILGFCIIASSTICKVPQIHLILKNKSTKGLSTTAFELEVVGFTIALGYCIFKQLPFSAYGELVFLLVQAIIQVALIYYFSHVGFGTWLKIGMLWTALFLMNLGLFLDSSRYSALAPIVLIGNLDPFVFELLYASQHAIFFISRIPQITHNYKNKNTGHLSFITNFMNFGGCIVRLFTSIQEKAPISMAVGTVLGVFSNGVVVYQMIHYSQRQEKVQSKTE